MFSKLWFSNANLIKLQVKDAAFAKLLSSKIVCLVPVSLAADVQIVPNAFSLRKYSILDRK